jgi:transposase
MQSARKLQKENGLLKEKLEHKNSQLEQQTAYIKTLEATLIDFKKNRFGVKSEKSDPNQRQLFNEVELITDAKKIPKPKGKKKKTGKRTSLPKNLERIIKVHDLDEDKKICPHDGNTLKHIGEVITEQFYLKPAVVKVIKHKQYKYACSCGKHIITAKKPKDMIPKSIATPELLSHICVSKYADSLPLYRINNMFKRIDVNISRQVMANWIIKCASALQPLVNLIADNLYDQPCVHIDD